MQNVFKLVLNYQKPPPLNFSDDELGMNSSLIFL